MLAWFILFLNTVCLVTDWLAPDWLCANKVSRLRPISLSLEGIGAALNWNVFILPYNYSSWLSISPMMAWPTIGTRILGSFLSMLMISYAYDCIRWICKVFCWFSTSSLHYISYRYFFWCFEVAFWTLELKNVLFGGWNGVIKLTPAVSGLVHILY